MNKGLCADETCVYRQLCVHIHKQIHNLHLKQVMKKLILSEQLCGQREEENCGEGAVLFRNTNTYKYIQYIEFNNCIIIHQEEVKYIHEVSVRVSVRKCVPGPGGEVLKKLVQYITVLLLWLYDISFIFFKSVLVYLTSHQIISLSSSPLKKLQMKKSMTRERGSGSGKSSDPQSQVWK